MGTSLEAGSKPLMDVTVDKSTILVLGNEGSGVRTNVQRACDVQVRVEGGPAVGEKGQDVKGMPVDSLNVSVTGGILMHFLRSSGTAASGTGSGDQA